jgi:hypothetical protein
MGRLVRTVGALSILAVPLAIGIGDQLRLSIIPEELGAVTEWGEKEAAIQLTGIGAHLGTYTASAYCFLVAALLTVPAALTVWRLAAERSRRWAFTGVVLAMLGVLGQMVHLTAEYGVSLALARQSDVNAAAKMALAITGEPFILVTFAPFFLAILCVVPQAVALMRAKVAPLWAGLAQIGGTVVTAVLGSVAWTSAVYTLLAVVGWLPVVLAALRSPAPAPAPAPAPSGDLALA